MKVQKLKISRAFLLLLVLFASLSLAKKVAAVPNGYNAAVQYYTAYAHGNAVASYYWELGAQHWTSATWAAYGIGNSQVAYTYSTYAAATRQ